MPELNSSTEPGLDETGEHSYLDAVAVSEIVERTTESVLESIRIVPAPSVPDTDVVKLRISPLPDREIAETDI